MTPTDYTRGELATAFAVAALLTRAVLTALFG